MQIMSFKKILTTKIFFVLSFLMFSSIISACINPGMRSDAGVPINPFGGVFIVNGSKYPGSDVLQITYNLQVHNANDQGFFVSIEPENAIKDYVSMSSPPVYIPANSIGTLPISVWVGGLEKSGKLDVIYQCDDEGSQFLNPFIYIWIDGKGVSPPPASTCSTPRALSGCYQGQYRTYSCVSNQLAYNSRCTTYCCQSYGGAESVCSTDGSTCLSFNNLPAPTEGKVALVCNKDDCSNGIEKKIWFLLRLEGWDVVGKSYKTWTADELNNGNYDIIACTETSACNIGFNSILYNAHFDKQKAFLEIPGSNSAKAAYAFDYVSTASGRSVRTSQVMYATDVLTAGIQNPGVFANGNSFVGVDGKKVNEGTKPIANSSDNANSEIFKVKETIDHGRYAYIGLLTKVSISDITTDGETVIKRTLKWLKEGDAAFGGTNNNEARKGKIAYICTTDKCTSASDIELIKYLRKIGYSVDADSLKSWLTRDLGPYQDIVCTSSMTCNIPLGSNIYNAHKLQGKNFIEIPYTSKMNAAYSFAYIGSATGKIKSAANVTLVGNPLGDGLPSWMRVNVRNRGMTSLVAPISSPLVDEAHSNVKGVDQGLSSMFVVNSAGDQGRYIMVGWAGRFDVDNLTGDGKLLLQRAVNWANCGNISC